MKEIIIKKNEAGQRFDKFLAKYMNQAPKSFFYKMLRKKNITLNGKKAAGNEILKLNDTVRLFLSDETIQKFSGTIQQSPGDPTTYTPHTKTHVTPWPDQIHEDKHKNTSTRA